MKTKEERFWDKVDKNYLSPGGCWSWKGCVVKGVGNVRIDNKLCRVHYVAYELTYGKIPQNLWIKHKCKNVSCVNPSHIYLSKKRAARMKERAEKEPITIPGCTWIPLAGGKFTLINEYLAPEIRKRDWHIRNGYAVSLDDNKSPIRLHRLVTNAPNDTHVDHINGDRLDNRLENLRICTNEENRRNNNKLNKHNTSGYRGVRKFKKKWRAQICVNGEIIHLGTFSDAIQAAHVYDEAALKHHGEFATTNKKLGRLP